MLLEDKISAMIRDEYSGDRNPRPDLLASRIASMTLAAAAKAGMTAAEIDTALGRTGGR